MSLSVPYQFLTHSLYSKPNSRWESVLWESYVLTDGEGLAVLPLHPALLQQQGSNWLANKRLVNFWCH